MKKKLLGPIIKIKQGGKEYFFEIAKPAVRIPSLGTYTAEDLQKPENSAVVMHLLNKGCSILRELSYTEIDNLKLLK